MKIARHATAMATARTSAGCCAAEQRAPLVRMILRSQSLANAPMSKRLTLIWGSPVVRYGTGVGPGGDAGF
jgi:hypothetical protein